MPVDAAPATARRARAVPLLPPVGLSRLGPAAAPPDATPPDPRPPDAPATDTTATADAPAAQPASPITTPKIGPSTAPPKRKDEPPAGGVWAATGLETRSAFHLPVAERLDPYGPRPEGIPELTRDQIVRYALDNPLIKQAEAKIDAMQAQVQRAKFLWIPIIDATAGLSPGVNVRCDDVLLDDGTTEGFEFQFCRSGRDPDLDVQTVQGYFSQLGQAGVRFTVGLNTVVPLYTFGKGKQLRKLAEAGLAITKLQKATAQQQTILLVLQAHVTLLLARESQAILRESKSVLDKAHRRVTKDLGDPDDWAADPEDTNDLRDPDDLTKVQLAAVEVEQKMAEALKVEALALSALWALGGSAAPAGFDVVERKLRVEPPKSGTLPLSDYVEIAAKQRPEAKMASAAVAARRAQQRLARSMFLPDIGIALSFGVAVSNAADRDMSQLYYQDRFNNTRFTAALAMRWRFDAGQIFELRRARAEVRAADHQREAAQLLLAREVTTAYQDLVEAERKLATAERAVELSWRLVLSQELSDSAGGGDSGELLRSLEKWYRKRFEQAEAVHGHNEAVARLGRAVGVALVGGSAGQAATPPDPSTTGPGSRRSRRAGAKPSKP